MVYPQRTEEETMRTDKRKTMKALRRLAEAQGWVVDPTKNGHLMWKSPAGQIVTSGSTESDWRAHRNHLARLRRCGLNL
jgi:hypothetical protein